MVFDTSASPPAWVHIGIVHGGVVCSNFYKNLKFPEIFSRTEDSEVLQFIRDIMNGDNDYPEYLEYGEYPEYPDICTTIRGPRTNVPCVFPFNFNGIEKTTCIMGRLRTDPWCATKVDVSNNYLKGEWGYCSQSCPNSGR